MAAGWSCAGEPAARGAQRGAGSETCGARAIDRVSSYLQNIFALNWTAHSFCSTLHTGKSHLCRLERRCRSTSGKLQAEAESVARMPHMQNSCTSYTKNWKEDSECRLTPESK